MRRRMMLGGGKDLSIVKYIYGTGASYTTLYPVRPNSSWEVVFTPLSGMSLVIGGIYGPNPMTTTKVTTFRGSATFQKELEIGKSYTYIQESSYFIVDGVLYNIPNGNCPLFSFVYRSSNSSGVLSTFGKNAGISKIMYNKNTFISCKTNKECLDYFGNIIPKDVGVLYDMKNDNIFQSLTTTPFLFVK